MSIKTYIKDIALLIKLILPASPGLLTAMLFIAMLSGFLPFTLVFINSQIIEKLTIAATTSENKNNIHDLIILVILFGVVGFIVQFVNKLSAFVITLCQTKTSNYIQQIIAEKSMSLDIAYFEDSGFQNKMQNVLSEASYRPLMIVQQLIQIFSTVITLASVSLVLLNWQALIIPCIILPLLLSFRLSIYFAKSRVALVTERAEMRRKAQYLQSLAIGDSAAKEIRLLGLKKLFLTKIKDLSRMMYEQDLQLVLKQIIFFGFLETSLSLVQPILVAFTAFETILKNISIGQFAFYTQSFYMLKNNFNGLVSLMSAIHENKLFAQYLSDFMSLNSSLELALSDKEPSIDTSIPDVEFINVNFGYGRQTKQVISNLSFKIDAGEVVSVVGNNGAGKTTMVKLLTGLYRPVSGQILVGGVDITTISVSELRQKLSVVFQDFNIYHFSLSENIGIGNVDKMYDQNEIQTASIRSGLDKIVESLPHGYATILARFFELGHELSGGQKQLVALTRMLMRNSPILIMDEPSSSLDITAEQRFFDDLLQKHKELKQTIIFISHRFTTTRKADRILVMRNGGIIEQGTHDELMYLHGDYYTMFVKNSKAFI